MAHRDLRNPFCNIMLITMPVCNKQVHIADNEKTTTTKTCLYACAAVEQLIAFLKGCVYTPEA